MKRTILTLFAAAAVISASAAPKALYVKKGDSYTKYNFGVVDDLRFSNGGKTLTIAGYGIAINLDDIDYITFTAPVQKSLTATQQKEKMIAIGEEVNKRIDLYNVEDAIHMYECFTRSDKSNDWNPYCEYEVPQEYWDVHNEFTKNIIAAASGDMAAIAKARAGATNLYKFEDYTGVYNANSKTLTWERISEADYFEMRFRADDGDNYVVRLTPSKDFTSYVTTDYRGQLPRTIEILLAKGNTTIASGTLKSELKQDQSIAFDIQLACGKYAVNEKLKIENNGVTSDLTVNVDGERFVTANRKVSGKNLLVYDEMYDAIDATRHWHDEDGNCQGEDYNALTAHFFRGNAYVDVLGQLQAKAIGSGFNKIYNHFKDMDDAPYYELELGNGRYIYTCGKILSKSNDNSVVKRTDYDKNYYEELAKYLNNYSDVTFYYDGKPEIQGYLSFGVEEDIDEYYEHYDTSRLTDAYTVIDDYLVRVMRAQEWIGDNYTYSPWSYTINNENEGGMPEIVTVDDEKVIYPMVLQRVDYYDTPILMFPDLTSFSFEDFFDETSFKKLVDDYDDIISTYDTIVGRDEK